MHKKIILVAFFLAVLSFILISAQEQTQPPTTPVSIMVRIRVLARGQFVRNLTLQDIQLFEEGFPQKIDGLLEVSGNQIQRSEPPQELSSPVPRNFILLFQLTEYDPKVDEAIRHLFDQVLLPGDSLSVMTTAKSYYITPDAIQTRPKKELADEVIGNIRKDTMAANTLYLSLLRDLKKIVRSIDQTPGAGFEDYESEHDQFSVEIELPKYRETLEKLDQMRGLDERRILAFAQRMKAIAGQKIIVFFYQREFRPEIAPMTLNTLASTYQDQPEVLAGLQDLFQNYSRNVIPNVGKIRQAFADAQILLHFVFSHFQPKDVTGLVMKEQSEDVYRTFSDVATSTGGIVDTSKNLLAGLKNAAEASKDYYLLFYTPPESSQKQDFRSISVRVKGKDCQVFHRLGYFSE